MGFDLSLTATGVAELRLVDGLPVWKVKTVRSKPTARSVRARAERLRAIRRQIVDGVDGDVFAVFEAPAFSQSGGAAHERAGLWWQIADDLLEAGARVVEATPTARARYATGKGRVGKKEVLSAVSARYGLRLANDNEADAVALAAMGARLKGFPVESRNDWWLNDSAASVQLGD